MQTQSRIPTPLSNSYSSMDKWFANMQASGLFFNPEDRPVDIVEINSGEPIFSTEECVMLDQIIDIMFEIHGDKVCEVAFKHTHKQLMQMIVH